MKKLKFAAILLALGMILPACERDDICIEDITPQLIVRFYDKDNPESLKPVQNLSVRIDGIEGELDNETIKPSTDSIAIPLRVEQNFTKIFLSIIQEGEEVSINEDALDMSYVQEDQFISRSCGYRAIFLDLTTDLVQDADNWIQDANNVSTPQEITDENQAHVKIYH